MRSIPTIFLWDPTTHQMTNRPLKAVDWVFQGKGIATRKYNGVAILVEHGKMFRRVELRQGELITGFIRLQDFNPKKPYVPIPGWVPISASCLTAPSCKEERGLQEACFAYQNYLNVLRELREKKTTSANPYAMNWDRSSLPNIPDGTYELCGPSIRGNKEKLSMHLLFRHGACVVKQVPRSFEGLKKFLETYEGEGIVWHYQEGNALLMAKVKRTDFGFSDHLVKIPQTVVNKVDTPVGPEHAVLVDVPDNSSVPINQ